MPNTESQRLKLLYLMKILLDKTDESHMLTVNELSAELNALEDKSPVTFVNGLKW